MSKDRRILFSGEAQLAMWGESSTAGAWVKLWIHPEDLESFKAIKARAGKQAGQRLGVCIVEIAHDETVVEQPDPTPAPAPRRASSMGDLALLAVRWCRDPRFHRWMHENPMLYECEEHSQFLRDAIRIPPGNGETAEARDESIAKAFLLVLCHVEERYGELASRKLLDTDELCASAFHALVRIPFSEYLKGQG